jgi:hypothetical protein
MILPKICRDLIETKENISKFAVQSCPTFLDLAFSLLEKERDI